jgi:hypothetical protein
MIAVALSVLGLRGITVLLVLLACAAVAFAADPN